MSLLTADPGLRRTIFDGGQKIEQVTETQWTREELSVITQRAREQMNLS